MTNYNKSTNFAVKDGLQSGDPNKIVSGAEIDTEFNNISSASTTKIDKVTAAQVNNIAVFTATGAIQDGGKTIEDVIPSGLISMWSGGIASIPFGWSLCDGSNGTPDLRDRFVVGAGGSYSPNNTGGSKDAVVVEHGHTMSSAGNHTHSINDPGHNHSYASSNTGNEISSYNPGSSIVSPQTGSTGSSLTNISINSNGDHTHTINNTGESGTDKNLPPYFALAFIMKL